jgi:hypothetical protein
MPETCTLCLIIALITYVVGISRDFARLKGHVTQPTNGLYKRILIDLSNSHICITPMYIIYTPSDSKTLKPIRLGMQCPAHYCMQRPYTPDSCN